MPSGGQNSGAVDKPSHDLTTQLLAYVPAAWDYIWAQWLAPWAHLLPALGLLKLVRYRRQRPR
jgi:hypothetical protein